MAGESGKLSRLGVGSGSEPIELVNVSTAGAAITLDMDNQAERLFNGTPAIAAGKILALDNDLDALRFDFAFQLATPQAIQMPANFRMADALWDNVTKTWTALDAGFYQAIGLFDGTNWNLTINGVFN